MYSDLMIEQNDYKKIIEDNYGKVNINLDDGSYEKAED